MFSCEYKKSRDPPFSLLTIHSNHALLLCSCCNRCFLRRQCISNRFYYNVTSSSQGPPYGCGSRHSIAWCRSCNSECIKLLHVFATELRIRFNCRLWADGKCVPLGIVILIPRANHSAPQQPSRRQSTTTPTLQFVASHQASSHQLPLLNPRPMALLILKSQAASTEANMDSVQMMVVDNLTCEFESGYRRSFWLLAYPLQVPFAKDTNTLSISSSQMLSDTAFDAAKTQNNVIVASLKTAARSWFQTAIMLVAIKSNSDTDNSIDILHQLHAFNSFIHFILGTSPSSLYTLHL